MSLRVVFPAGDYPQVLVSPTAWEDMFYITEKVSTEVGWMATVEQLSQFRFRILEVFLLEQEAHATTTELMAEALDGLIRKLLDEGRVEDVQRLNSWHHSHVNMGLTASSDDEKTLAWFMSKVDGVPFVAIRTNKKGEVTADIGYPNGMVLKDVTVEEELPVKDISHLKEKWDKPLKELVKPLKTSYSWRGKGGYGKGGYGKSGQQQYGYYAGYGSANNQQAPLTYDSSSDDYQLLDADWPIGENADLVARKDAAAANWNLIPFNQVRGKAPRYRWLTMARRLVRAEDDLLKAIEQAKKVGDLKGEERATHRYAEQVQEILDDNEEFLPEDREETISGR